MDEQQPEQTPKPKLCPWAAWSVVLGFVGTTCLSVLAGVPAFYCGWRALREIRASEGRLHGRSLAALGMTLGVLTVAVLVAVGFTLVPTPAKTAARKKELAKGLTAGFEVIEGSARKYAQSHALRDGEGVTWDQMVRAGVVKTNLFDYSRFQLLPLPEGVRFEEWFNRHPVVPGRPVSVPQEFRLYFAPDVPTNDPVWRDPVPTTL